MRRLARPDRNSRFPTTTSPRAPGPKCRALGLLLAGSLAGLAAGQTTDLELPQDVIEFSNGHQVKGRVVFEDAETLILRTGSRDKTYKQAKLQFVDALRRKLPKGLDLVDSLPYGSVGLHLDAARDLETMGLPREAHLLYWRVLSFASDETQAHEGVGSKRSSNRWLVPGDKRLIPFEKRRLQATDWGTAWEFQTTHFEFRSNLPLETCLTVGFDLERLYRGFFETFGAGFGLHETTEPMAVAVHADRSSYPELSGHLGGYFSPVDNQLYLDASEGLDRRLLAHEVTHQLLFNTARRTRQRKGSIPGWLDEGLAQYVQAATEPAGETIRFHPGTEVQAWLEEHAKARDPFSLKRVLNLELGDFRGTESRLKYAQSWSLVQFCLHGMEGDYRPGFLDFVQGCYDGQSSGTHFEKRLGVDMDDLEDVWLDWVRERAGQ